MLESTHASYVGYCKRCIFNTLVDPDLYFNKDGLCNHCQSYDENVAPIVGKDRSAELNQVLKQIKSSGKGKKYDCIIGVSGGVDSCYVAHMVKQFGLRPLAVHCDNGWNSELAVSNIHNLLKALDIDLYTYVINWDEFKDIQVAYLQASVIDIEVPSDHAIFATLYKAAAKFGVNYILSGENFTTEGYLPETWVHWKNDIMNLRAIHKKFGKLPFKTFPTLGPLKQLYYKRIRHIQYIHLLDYFNYVKSDAKEILSKNYEWRDYGGKHYESIFTRFYQSYILPKKFGVDKRYSHLSTLICNSQLTRVEALVEVAHPPYDPQKILEDKRYVVKKLGLTEASFDQLMALPVRNHTDYPSLLNVIEQLRPLIILYKRLAGLPVTHATKRHGQIAMLLDNPFERDYRVYLEAATLATRYDITLFALKDTRLPAYEIVDGIKVRRVFNSDIHRLLQRKLLKRQARLIARKGFEIIHAHDHLMLDVAYQIKKLQPSCKIIYDSHEMFYSWPLNLNNVSWFILLKSAINRQIQIWLEKKHSSVIDTLVTVNGSLAHNLGHHFNLSKPAVVLRNIPPFVPVQKGKHFLRKHFNLSDDKKILVFIGMHVYPKTLNIETVMDEISKLEDTAFILICKDDHNRKTVEQYAVSKGYGNVYFHGIIRPDEMNQYLCDCDIGLVPTWNKKDLSYWNALDNKLFNYLMSSIPILATAQPEYKAIVENYNIGVCVNPDFPDAYLTGYRALVENKEYYAEHISTAQKELNWEHESKKLLFLYESLLPTYR